MKGFSIVDRTIDCNDYAANTVVFRTPSMIKSIKVKLWLTLFVTLIVSLGSLLALSYFSVKHRFLDYATQQILDRLAPLETAVVEIYEESGNLTPFEADESLWGKLRDSTYRQYLNFQKRRAFSPLEPNQADWSERESLDKKLQPNQRAFFQHLVLFDAQKQLIAGRKKEDANYILQMLNYEGETIAHIGYVKPKAFLSSIDLIFVDEQIKSFAYLSIVMLFAALLITLSVSRWLITPLSRLAQSAKEVAAGNFSTRTGYRSQDELGKLCENFDDMTRSLEKNEVTRKQWVADVSHEMRTPLSVMKAQIEAMEDGIREPSLENLSLLLRNVDALSITIDDLYELSLTDLGELTLNKTKIQLASLIKEVAKEYESKFEQKSLKLEMSIPNDAQTFINLDRERIAQLLYNLFENSYRYTDAGGQVKISLWETSEAFIVSLEDSEPGVPDDAIDRIYDRLFRVEASRSRSTGGAGLGLSLCKGLAEAHGATIFAEASELGGLKQTLTFPKND